MNATRLSPWSATTRRRWLTQSAVGGGAAALHWLLNRDLSAATPAAAAAGATTAPHHAPRARSVIVLFMGGGPSQVDTFDPKPELNRWHGGRVPESIAQHIPRIARAPLHNLFGSPFSFARHGQCGLEVSELFPELAQQIDHLCLLRSMKHDSPIHAPAEYLALTGTQVGNRPSLGAWVTYGLGSECDNLPAFMVFFSNGETTREPGWGAGFLPARFQGTRVDQGVPNLALPAGLPPAARRRQLDLLADLNRRHRDSLGSSAELDARIDSYELAYRMQTAAPEAFELANETAETQALYGLDRPETREFGTHCLLARRMVERGVRFIQLRHGKWDAHGKLVENHRGNCRATDRPLAGLISDLQRRGLLDQTLLIWGGEFGRTPAAQGGLGPDAGRDHSPSGYTMWLAGGGVRGGQAIGATDPVGYAAIDRPLHPQSLHATMLHLLGLDQYQLFYERHNRRELATVNGAEIIHEALA
ncbi:MAG: DUF1501 domain-containing protein [Pirellulales bacterium]